MKLETLAEFLEHYGRPGAATERPDIERRLWQTYGVEAAVCILDMAGFTRLTQRHGIVHYMAMIWRMRCAVRPLVEARGGTVIKFEADDAYLRFPDVLAAIEAMADVQHALARLNAELPPDEHIRVAAGIDFGRILLLGESDFYGAPVNVASKLGEDLAGDGDILITAEAFRRLPGDAHFRTEPFAIAVSGVAIDAFRVVWK